MQCKLENITVHYEEFGEGTPIFILHGWSMTTFYVTRFYEPIFKDAKGWKRIYLDLPGHGKTEGNDSVKNLDDILSVILQCIDKISAGEKFAVLGISMGGYLARGVLNKKFDAVNGLALIVPVIIAETEKRALPPQAMLMDTLSKDEALTENETLFLDLSIIRTNKWLEILRQIPDAPEGEQGDDDFQTKIRENSDSYSLSFNPDNLPAPFMGPSLFIAGKQDWIAGYQDAWKILENYPRTSYVVLDRMGHLLEDTPSPIQPLIQDWLLRMEESIG